MNIIQIIPNLKISADGIADYSLKLADGLLIKYGILTHFLVCQQQADLVHSIHNFPVINLPQQSSAAFLDSLPKNIDSIILHYSDYPYDQKYCSPFWLLKALEVAKRQNKIRLVAMFHEFPYIYVRKTLHFFPTQNWVASGIAKLADAVLTNNFFYKTLIEKRLNHPVKTVYVFSNVGEPEQTPLLKNRKRRLIVFGTPLRRARIYQRAFAMLLKACEILEIEEICDVGAPLDLKISEIQGIPLVQMGKRSADEISNLMSCSLAGIASSHNNKLLTKSGVFAAYCAHGLVPVITRNESSPGDDLEIGGNFLFAGSEAERINMESLQKIADRAYTWYNNHRYSKTVELFASQLLEKAPTNDTL